MRVALSLLQTTRASAKGALGRRTQGTVRGRSAIRVNPAADADGFKINEYQSA